MALMVEEERLRQLLRGKFGSDAPSFTIDADKEIEKIIEECKKCLDKAHVL